MPETIRLGIDYGTTTTRVSLRVGDDLPRALPIGEDGQTKYMPSVVYFPPDKKDWLQQVMVGERADGITAPGLVIRSAKRCLGCDGQRCALSRSNGQGWCQGDGKINVPGIARFDPEKIAYFILREALKRAINEAHQSGVDLRKHMSAGFPVGLGCPAAFNLKQRNLLVKVAHEVGLKNATIQQVAEEPIFSGFAFSRFVDFEGRVLIYDFGGGSFDTAVIQIEGRDRDRRITILGTAGDNWLGGDDIDNRIERYFVRHLAKQLNAGEPEVEAQLTAFDRRDLHRLAKRAKEELSATTEFSDVLLSEQLGPLPIDLTRRTFDGLLAESRLIERSFEAVLLACKMAHALDIGQDSDLLNYQSVHTHRLTDAAKEIQQVVLVGGVSKIPLVRSQIVNIFGAGTVVSESVIDPIDAVSIGAAYPHEVEHYSLAYPPFEVVLELQARSESEKRVVKVFSPFEYHDYHAYSGVNLIPAYRSAQIEIDQPCRSARLGFRRVGTADWNWLGSLGFLESSTYEVIVQLDGQIKFRELYGSNPDRLVGDYPFVHHLQAKIAEARKRRAEQQHQDQIDRTLASEKSMFTEN